MQQILQLTFTNKQIPAPSQDGHCRLAGLVVYSGSATKGHYVAYINQNGRWRLYGDARVQTVAPAAAEQAAERAYLYFYNKVS